MAIGISDQRSVTKQIKSIALRAIKNAELRMHNYAMTSFQAF